MGVQNNPLILKKCKYCGQEFDTSDKPKGWMANHVRWCDKNSKDYSNSSEKAVKAMNLAKAKTEYYNQYTRAKKLGKTVPSSPLKGTTHKGIPHTEEMKKHLSEKALNSKHRRLRKNPIEYNGILLDSTWELELAMRLDFLQIEWIRPEPLPWTDDSGVNHNYFPDFYLPKYDIYLDPKNVHAISVQKKKLKKLRELYPNIIILKTLDECKEFCLHSLIGRAGPS